MRQPLPARPGTHISMLDTPCLILDLDALEHNINYLATYYKDSACKLRPHVKNHRSPDIAWMQLRAGGTVNGVCASKVSEAAVMVQAGIPQVLIANQVITKAKIDRLCSLCRSADMIVAVDNEQNVYDLDEAAQSHGVNLGIILEIDTNIHRSGIQSEEDAINLARKASQAKGLTFRGIMSHQSIDPSKAGDRNDRQNEAKWTIKHCLDIKDAVEKSGFPCEIVSTGETWSYDVARDSVGVTEIQGGSYITKDTSHYFFPEFQQAIKVLGTIVSTPRAKTAIGDIGVKAATLIKGAPEVEGHPNVTVTALQAEHTLLDDPNEEFKVGDQFQLVVAMQDALVNRWDRYVGIRNDVVERVIEIAARGRHN